MRRILAAVALALGAAAPPEGPAPGLEPLRYNNPGLVVDLGVGLWAWPLPMDYDRDGDLDLVVSCPDVPFNGTYLFENPGGDRKFPVFRPPVKVGPAPANVRPSYVGGDVRLLTPGRELTDFRASHFGTSKPLGPATNLLGPKARLRANQWQLADLDGDGRLDLVVGVEDWADYGWDDAYDARGRWTRGPLHGTVWSLRGREGGDWDAPVAVSAGGKAVDTFGMPSPCLADFDRDGDLDMICGEFLDKFTYFENVGGRTAPEFAAGRRVVDGKGDAVAMRLQMIVPVPVDWDGDGDTDLVVGDEDGRVALVEHTGEVKDGLPRFRPPVYFKQEATDLKFGALVTPSAFDWDGDGDVDLVCGDSAGDLGWFENLGGDPPRWAAPRLIDSADGKPLRVMAGPNGSIQGPCEAKWGYTQPCVADWDLDGLPDVVVNSIWGKVVWHRNVGTRTAPKLAAAAPVEVDWPGTPPKPAWTWWTPARRELVTEWRTTPAVFDWNADGLPDLVMLDHEGYLAVFERARSGDGLVLKPGKRAFRGERVSAYDSKHLPRGQEPGPLRLNVGRAGASGRRTLCVTDWDGDGKPDVVVDGLNASVLRNVGTEGGVTTLRDEGPVATPRLAGHSTCPTVADLDRDGKPDLILGAEDGRLYRLKNPRR